MQIIEKDPTLMQKQERMVHGFLQNKVTTILRQCTRALFPDLKPGKNRVGNNIQGLSHLCQLVYLAQQSPYNKKS